MEKLRAVQYFEVFDIAYKSEKDAETALEGWEHKEKVREVYVVLKEVQVPVEINLADNDYPHFRDEKLANEHIKEELDWLAGNL